MALLTKHVESRSRGGGSLMHGPWTVGGFPCQEQIVYRLFFLSAVMSEKIRTANHAYAAPFGDIINLCFFKHVSDRRD